MSTAAGTRRVPIRDAAEGSKDDGAGDSGGGNGQGTLGT